MRSHYPLSLGLLVLATLPAAQTPSRDAMRGLRKAALTRTAADWRFRRDQAFPWVFGVVVDFPIGDQTATIVCMRDGSTSLYTTGSFGIIGGGDHPSVRRASAHLVKLAGSFWVHGKPTKSTAYPAKGRVRFSLLGYDGSRVVESTLQSVNGRQDHLGPLWDAANRVLTELRAVSDDAERRSARWGGLANRASPLGRHSPRNSRAGTRASRGYGAFANLSPGGVVQAP